MVDDSAATRQVIIQILQSDREIEVVGQATNPYEARDRIIELKPDVLTLDVEMPKMDGLTFLKILMEKHPLPVIVFSTLTHQGTQHALEALNLGAAEILGKPNGSISKQELTEQLIFKVKAAAAAKRIGPRNRISSSSAVKNHGSFPANTQFHPKQLIVLGSSTGGTEALREILCDLPANMPGILIVQHIPANFSRTFANRLNELCALSVKEAESGDIAAPGTVLIAPGGYHMVATWSGGKYRVDLRDGPPVWHQRPAVDVLFKSILPVAGKHIVAGILTGMGKDGAESLLQLRESGAQTFAQAEASCVVYGMPKAAYEIGATQQMVPLEKIAITLQTLVNPKPKVYT